jgi:8-oxo-dGTP diphosphatase
MRIRVCIVLNLFDSIIFPTMTKVRFKFTPAVFLYLEKDSKVLLLRRFNTGYRDGQYSMVAGHHDGNEPLARAMVREAREEVGIVINEEDLKLVHVMHRMENGDERVDFYFTTDSWRGEITNLEQNKCDELTWYSINNLPEAIIPYVRQAIVHITAGNNYSTDGIA